MANEKENKNKRADKLIFYKADWMPYLGNTYTETRQKTVDIPNNFWKSLFQSYYERHTPEYRMYIHTPWGQRPDTTITLPGNKKFTKDSAGYRDAVLEFENVYNNAGLEYSNGKYVKTKNNGGAINYLNYFN